MYLNVSQSCLLVVESELILLYLLGFCTLLRSSHGMVLSNWRHMHTNKLESYLTWLDDCDKDKAKRLLFPNDPQDVPTPLTSCMPL